MYGNPADPFSITGNAVVNLDRFVLGDAHLYHRLGASFDPEGILSTMPAIVNVIIGYYAGKFIQNRGKNYETIARLLLTGALFILLAICWNAVFPINGKDIKDTSLNKGIFNYQNNIGFRVNFDLRNPQNQYIRDEIMEAFGLNPHKSYNENCLVTKTINTADLLKA